MKISVQTDYFQDAEEAYAEIRQAGLHPLEMNVPVVSNSSHWHNFSTVLYILDGELEITDVASQQTTLAGPGSRVEVPERVLHSEHSNSGYRIIAGMSIDPASMTEPVDRDPATL